MTALRNFFIAAVAFLAIVATPTFAQVTVPPQQSGQAIVNSNDPKKIAEDLLRWSIPSGDFIAQSIFSIVPAAGTTAELKSSQIGQSMPVTSAIGDIVGLINILIVGLGVLIGTTRIVEWSINVGREGKWEAGDVNLWAPVRFALAFFMILPIPNGNGFNLAQYAFGTLARAGYSAGNATWNYAVGLSTTSGRATIVPAMSPKIPEMVAHIGMIELCRAAVDGYSYQQFKTPASAAVANWVEEENASKVRLAVRFDFTKTEAMGEAANWLINLISACGYISIDKGTSNDVQASAIFGASPDSGLKTSLFYRAHRPAIEETRRAAADMANTVMTAWFKGGVARNLAIGLAVEKYMTTAPRAYAARIASEAAQILSQSVSRAAAAGKTTAESQFSETAKYAGWTNAGSFFITYANVASSAANVAGQIPNVSPPITEDLRKLYGEALFDGDLSFGGVLNRYRANIAHYVDPNAPDWTRAGLGGQSGAADSTDSTSSTSRVGVLFPGATSLNNMFMTSIQDVMRSFLDPSYRGDNGFNPNILQTQIEMGHRLMFIGTALMTASFVSEETIKSTAENAGGFFRYIPGPSVVISALSGAAKGAVKLGFLISTTVGAFCIGIGALWAYLLPAMLAFMWFAVVLGWVMLVIEALLVASLMGIANMSTGETTVLSQKSAHGINVAFNLAFRPILMTVGLILSVMLYSLFASAVSNGIFRYAVPSMLGDNTYGPIGFVLMLMALTVFNFALLMWLGNMAETVANNVPTWLGMNAGPQYNSSQSVSQLNNLGTMAGAHQTAGAFRSGAKTLSKLSMPAKKKGDDDENSSGGDEQSKVAETGGRMK